MTSHDIDTVLMRENKILQVANAKLTAALVFLGFNVPAGGLTEGTLTP